MPIALSRVILEGWELVQVRLPESVASSWIEKMQSSFQVDGLLRLASKLILGNGQIRLVKLRTTGASLYSSTSTAEV